MYDLKRILVCLDLTEMDDQLIKAAASFANHLSGSNFYFLHIVKSLELPPDLLEKYPDLIAPVDENVKRIVQERLELNFKNLSEFEYSIDVVEGSTTDVILRWSKIKEVDLIIMGRKLKENGSGVLPDKVVKLCHCSFLFVPYNSYHGLKRIMVPIDFSDSSKMALEQAIAISENSGATIICQHIYSVPTGYHTSGKSYAEFAKIMQSNAVKNFMNFLLGMGLRKDQYVCIYTLSEGIDPSKIVLQTATKEKIDFIIMGSKGRTGMASILLGSTAMKIIKSDLDFEILVVKDKKENMGFLDALLNL